MKKTLKVLLVLVMLCAVTLTLVGCGNDEDTNKDNTVNNESNVNNNNEETTVEISRGEWQGNKYVNDFAGVTFNLPEGWAKYSDEEIAQLMNIGVETLNEDQQKLAELAEQSGVYGMVVNDPSTAANIMVMIEKPVLKVTPDYYLSSIKQQLEAVDAMDYEVGETYTTKIANEDYYALDAVVAGYPISQHYFIKAVDDCFVAIIVTTTAEGQLEEIVNCFE